MAESTMSPPIRRAVYRILDEPEPTAWASLAREPYWPLLSLMLVGGWLAWPWFALNALVLRSASRRQEIGVILGVVLVCFLLHWAILAASVELGVSDRALTYAALLFPAVRLSAGYWLFIRQTTTWDIWVGFGGAVSSGALVLVGGMLLQGRIEALLVDSFLAAALL